GSSLHALEQVDTGFLCSERAGSQIEGIRRSDLKSGGHRQRLIAPDSPEIPRVQVGRVPRNGWRRLRAGQPRRAAVACGAGSAGRLRQAEARKRKTDNEGRGTPFEY